MPDPDFDPQTLPATPLYYAGMHCQQCGGTSFWVRSATAECGNSRCGAAYAIFARSQPAEALPEKETANVR